MADRHSRLDSSLDLLRMVLQCEVGTLKEAYDMDDDMDMIEIIEVDTKLCGLRRQPICRAFIANESSSRATSKTRISIYH